MGVVCFASSLSFWLWSRRRLGQALNSRPYEGPDAVQTGTGGAKITKNGVDFWTNGTPPRRYQIFGFLTDTLQDKLLSGHAMAAAALLSVCKKRAAMD
jgi:hypothetical protein